MIDIIKRIRKFGKARQKDMAIALAFSFFRSLFGISQMIAILYAVRVLTGELDVRSGLLAAVTCTVICIFGNFATSYLEQVATLKTGFFMIADQRISIGNLLRKLPLGFFNRDSSGNLIATLTSTLSGVETAATMVMVGIISGLFNAAAFFLFMMFFDWRVGLVSGAGMVVYLLVVSHQMKVSHKYAPALQKAQSNLADASVSFLKGIQVAKAFQCKDSDSDWKRAVNGSCDANIRLTRQSMPSQFASGLTIAVFESLILLLSLFLQFSDPTVTVLHTVILLIFGFTVYAALNQAGSMLSMIGLLDAGMAEAEAVKDEQPLPTKLPLEQPVSNEIKLESVSFSYGNRPIIRNFSAVFPEHSFTAIIGPSGSGKTTLCRLIARFYEIDQGIIRLGGADIQHLDSEILMQKISMVFQNVYLFEDTVMNNIRFGKPDATLEEVQNAAKAANCHDFILSLPKGYDTVISEGGSSLSGGEKQRISIARAILKDAPIVILDEATSALDAENEQEILSAIERLTQNKTVIMIAHRLKTVQKADQILAIENGKLVQCGTADELILQDGLYRDFIQAREKAEGWQISNT